jgi:SAM-dependent methyltransferase
MTINDPRYLKKFQYRDPGNLNSRITIHMLFSTGRQDWAGFVFDKSIQKRGSAGTVLRAARSGKLTCAPCCRVRLVLSDLIHWHDLGSAQNADGPKAVQFHSESASLPPPNQAFDAELQYKLYHVPVPARAIEEAARVLKPGADSWRQQRRETHGRASYLLRNLNAL